MRIRPVNAQDAAALCAIYNHYVENTVVSFEEESITVADFAARIDKIRTVGLPWFVAEQDGTVLGYAYAARWQERSAYRFCALVSVYLAPGGLKRDTR
jgi:L-amino acid N-acyltransferase YncA